MSEYLNRLKHLRDAQPPPGNAPNVQSNVSFRKAIDYIEKLENDIVLLDRHNARLTVNNTHLRERYDEVCMEMRESGERQDYADDLSGDN